MEGDFIKINNWLLPLSWIYGSLIRLRNTLFEVGMLKSHSFDVPLISVGNITVGGTGKTPHVEYLIRLLQDKFRVAVLSRGYKRKSRGFVIANEESTVKDIGDEPYQMKQKFPHVTVAVDKNRHNGINKLTEGEAGKKIDVVLLDDAFQHRYVKPGINILLVDYHRLIIYDKLLPAGRLREPLSGKDRADIVIVTKCPRDLKPMEFRVITKAMCLYPYQHLYFTMLDYDALRPIYCGEERPLDTISADDHILLLTGIASPRQMIVDLSPYSTHIQPLTFGDHHTFTARDVEKINETFADMPGPKLIITTEKDATRLFGLKGLSKEVRHNIYTLPVKIEFMLGQEETFNENIIGYVRKNSRNSILVKAKDDNKSKDSHHSGNRPRTISFRNN
ncbi:tetraacyldisaccharide 4'-kinase [Xylanibacter rodentium]|jgi:tetraacyldisaccharide 4'-kinase|uniref:Tetraacyldisaccharide 4'-kinase n=3 Tax=Xylanibacter rodentium TaxID=2736289 RepID=A0ABX2AR69_9BACT|nr:tetraacyldisaccharide 4'-kinase [Xylanibacter rodentium]NPE11666.1 tetraacyldisaccharide 4'-kinase [Prevotella sp. PJ1A]NPE13207.1 tetraacyldisaccharide 4'-kinase [Xylanibacter rodentium]NPE38570.1 tetraacyldisaccharide 4'-kinase [Prevotella sp. PCJ2]